MKSLSLSGQWFRPDGAVITIAPTGIEFFHVFVHVPGGGLQPSLRTPITSMTAQQVREMIERQQLVKEEV